MTKFISLFCIALMAVAVSSATQQTNGEPGTGTYLGGRDFAVYDNRNEEPHALYSTQA